MLLLAHRKFALGSHNSAEGELVVYCMTAERCMKIGQRHMSVAVGYMSPEECRKLTVGYHTLTEESRTWFSEDCMSIAERRT